MNNYPSDIRNYDHVPGSPFYRDYEDEAAEEIAEMSDEELDFTLRMVSGSIDEIRGVRETQRAERYLAQLRDAAADRGLR